MWCREDISICRTSENKKCRLGEGGFGVVYKALMNGVDEVAVKLVKADKPTNKELTLFHKEVGHHVCVGVNNCAGELGLGFLGGGGGGGRVACGKMGRCEYQ